MTNFRATVEKTGTYFFIFCICLLCGCGYLCKQGRYVFKYTTSAVKNEKLLATDSVSEQTKEFIRLVQQIKHFAENDLGLKDNNNYTKFVEIDKKYLVDVVAAAGKTQFQQHTWWYPFFGNMPYKGYFERDDALKEARRLQKKGLDTYIGKVNAFSTLGYLTDPLYSFMVSYSFYYLASLIIHEQTHATIYLKNQSQFNEELASFVGDEGALLFIKSTYGDSSEQYQKALDRKADEETINRFLRNMYSALERIYSDSTLNDIDKLELKENMINDMKEDFNLHYDSMFRTDVYQNFTKLDLNNAYLMLSMTYNHDLDLYYRLYRVYKNDLPKTIGKLLTLKDSRDAKTELTNWCKVIE